MTQHQSLDERKLLHAKIEFYEQQIHRIHELEELLLRAERENQRLTKEVHRLSGDLKDMRANNDVEKRDVDIPSKVRFFR